MTTSHGLNEIDVREDNTMIWNRTNVVIEHLHIELNLFGIETDISIREDRLIWILMNKFFKFDDISNEKKFNDESFEQN